MEEDNMNHRVRPSRLFYGVGAVMIITAIIIIVVNVIVVLNQTNLQKHYIKVPGINTVVLEEKGDYIVYYAAKATFEGEKYDTRNTALPEIRVGLYKLREEEMHSYEVASDNGIDMPLFKTGNPVIRFNISEPGAYVLDVSYVTNEGPDVILNVTKDNIDEMYEDLQRSVLLGMALVVVGLLLMAGTLMARLWFIKRSYDDKKFKELP